MTAVHELIPELVIGLIVAPMLTGLWLLFVNVNNRIVDRKGKGSKIEAHRWRLLIQMFFVSLFLTLIHSCQR